MTFEGRAQVIHIYSSKGRKWRGGGDNQRNKDKVEQKKNQWDGIVC